MDTHAAYDESASPTRMAHDGRVAGRRLHLLEQAARRAVLPAPPLTWDGYPREVAKPEISIDAATARLAALYVD